MYQRGIVNILLIVCGLIFVAVLIGVFTSESGTSVEKTDSELYQTTIIQ